MQPCSQNSPHPTQGPTGRSVPKAWPCEATERTVCGQPAGGTGRWGQAPCPENSLWGLGWHSDRHWVSRKGGPCPLHHPAQLRGEGQKTTTLASNRGVWVPPGQARKAAGPLGMRCPGGVGPGPAGSISLEGPHGWADLHGSLLGDPGGTRMSQWGAVGVDGDWEGCPSPSSGHPGTLETPGFYTPRGKTGAGEPVVGWFSKFS